MAAKAGAGGLVVTQHTVLHFRQAQQDGARVSALPHAGSFWMWCEIDRPGQNLWTAPDAPCG
jgi:hypothetical protein